MQKEIHIVKGGQNEDFDLFKNRIFDLSTIILDQCRPNKFKVTLTTKHPPRISVIPFRREKVAVLSITGKSSPCFDIKLNAEGYIAGFQVEEAVPLSYVKTWKDTTPTPGECLLTLFHRKPGLDTETFIRRWHEGHTALSLKLHPLWNYNRNVVQRALTNGATWYDGIVEEQFKEASDLLNPITFFGPPLKVPIHMFQVYKDTSSFIDMKRIETYLATEYHFKS